MDAKEPKQEAFHLAGDRLGNFVILAELGRGSMGVVYEALQEGLKRKVALKILPANITLDEKHVRRFHREAESVGKLNHPNIIRIYDNGRIDKTHYFAMELVEGAKEFGTVRCEDAASIRRVAGLVRDAALALAHAHEQGVIHRDIKPSNLLLDRTGRVVVTDFGLASIKDSASLTSTDAIVGTPKYMSPEQILPGRHKLDGRADIYALGATLYECVAGRPPLEAPSVQAFFKAILEQRPASPRKLNKLCPHDLATIILRCLEKDPGDRYQSGVDLADDLDRLLEGKRIVARPKGTLAIAAGWLRRHKIITGLGAVAVIAVVILLGLGGELAKQTGRTNLLAQMNAIRDDPDLDLAIETARRLAGKNPNSPEIVNLLRSLYRRLADLDLEAKEINWLGVLRDLDRAARTQDLWYLMALVELGRTDAAREAAQALPEESETRALTLARLDLSTGSYAEAIASLTGRGSKMHPFAYLVLARAHRLLADQSDASSHLAEALASVDAARERMQGLHVRWLRTQIQYEKFQIQLQQGKSVNVRDSVDDFSVVASQWWGKIARAWEGMTTRDVSSVQAFIRRILLLARMPDAFAAEIELKGRKMLQAKEPREKVIAHLLLAVAHISKRELSLALDSLQAAYNQIDEEEALLPYVYWGISMVHRAQGNLRFAINNARLALEGATLDEANFDALEPLARHVALLVEDARKAGRPVQEKRATEALRSQLGRIRSPAAWVSDLLQQIASKASR